MVVSTSSFNFRDTVNEFLKVWYTNTWEDMYEVINEVSKEAVKKLKANSPKRPDHGSKYSKGWAAKTERGRTQVGATVYGKHGTYQLAHLLENGHAKRGGGRTNSYEHIAPVEEWAIAEAEERIIKRVSGL